MTRTCRDCKHTYNGTKEKHMETCPVALALSNPRAFDNEGGAEEDDEMMQEMSNLALDVDDAELQTVKGKRPVKGKKQIIESSDESDESSEDERITQMKQQIEAEKQKKKLSKLRKKAVKTVFAGWQTVDSYSTSTSGVYIFSIYFIILFSICCR